MLQMKRRPMIHYTEADKALMWVASYDRRAAGSLTIDRKPRALQSRLLRCVTIRATSTHTLDWLASAYRRHLVNSDSGDVEVLLSPLEGTE
jgi:hypothetical protein